MSTGLADIYPKTALAERRERERDREREKYVPKEKKLQCRIIGLSYEDTKENGEAVFKTKK